MVSMGRSSTATDWAARGHVRGRLLALLLAWLVAFGPFPLQLSACNRLPSQPRLRGPRGAGPGRQRPPAAAAAGGRRRDRRALCPEGTGALPDRWLCDGRRPAGRSSTSPRRSWVVEAISTPLSTRCAGTDDGYRCSGHSIDMALARTMRRSDGIHPVFRARTPRSKGSASSIAWWH